MTERDPIRTFARLVERDSKQIDLAEAALVMARIEYQELDASAQIERLAELASRADTRPEYSPLTNIQAMNKLLFEQENFAGNEEEYDDPRNSFLNDVLDRRKGIPITLSLIYTEVARRRGLPIVGVGFPGHFLTKYMTGSADIIIDPFHRGAIVTREGCADLLQQHFGAQAELKPEYLAASTNKEILGRMLNNLKGSYWRRRNFGKVLAMIQMSLALDPASSHDIRDRGMIYFTMNRYREAAADLKTYLRITLPEDPQAKEALGVLSRIRGMMN